MPTIKDKASLTLCEKQAPWDWQFNIGTRKHTIKTKVNFVYLKQCQNTFLPAGQSKIYLSRMRCAEELEAQTIKDIKTEIDAQIAKLMGPCAPAGAGNLPRDAQPMSDEWPCRSGGCSDGRSLATPVRCSGVPRPARIH